MLRRIVLALLLASVAHQAAPQTASPARVPCDQNPTYHKLDFLVGEWDIFDTKSGAKQGATRIEKTLKGCAILQSWNDTDGDEARSLYYVVRASGQWKQVWAEDSGGVRERSLQSDYAGEGLRFQAETLLRDGTLYMDHITLAPMSGGRVHQAIEASHDKGKTWELIYDAEYRHHK